MKIALDIGHNCSPDIGSLGILSEDRLNLEIGRLIATKLRLKHEVLCVTPQKALSVRDSLNQRVNKSNTWGAELYISLHHNCFNSQAYGTEVFALSKIGFRYANFVQQQLTGLGFYDRTTKTGEHLYVIKNTSCPAILIETFFVDNEKDCKLYKILGAEKIADAIVKGINDAGK
jgi:N-acetylmuramoyl-L-alanine amidase